MAADKLVDSALLDGALSATADSIRAINGTAKSGNEITWDPETGFSDAVDAMTSSATATAGDILSGKTAYAKGSKVTGTIATKTASNMTVSGKTVTAPAGYYASDQSKSVADGAYSGSVSAHSVSTTPVVTGAISGTVANIGTTTKPSGTDGTNYWTITPTGSVTTTGVSTAKGKATISTAGYIPAGSNESSAHTVNITPTVTAGTSRYIPKSAITNNASGGTSSGTINRGKQIKIGTGYIPSDTYYTAQANSGTLTVTGSGNTSCDGYATVSVPAKTPAFDGGALSGTATATGSNATISDSTNTSGISITTACTASRAAVLYNGAVAGWVSVSDNATALAADSTAMAAKTYYINGVTLPKSKSFSVTVYTGASTQTTFKFTTDANGNTTVTEE